MTERSAEYEEGWDAHHRGKLDRHNPYPVGSDAAMDWEDGRSQADSDENGDGEDSDA